MEEKEGKIESKNNQEKNAQNTSLLSHFTLFGYSNLPAYQELR
jgi:hypothetical protein